MKATFRHSTPADGAGIMALLAEAGLAPGTGQPEHLHWKYWQERKDWTGSRSFVMESGDVIVAHAAVVPGTIRWGPQRFRIVQMVDWAARSDAVGAGTSLMKQIGRFVDGMLSIGGSTHTRQLVTQLGFRRYGEATGYVRPLRPLRILGSGKVSWRLVARVVRSAAWRLSAPSADMQGRHIERLGADEFHRLAPLFPMPVRDMAVLERSEELLRHAVACPIVRVELYVLEREGHPCGYFLLALAGEQVRLTDCWMASDNLLDWRTLIQCAVHQAAQHDVAAELVTWSSDPLLSRCLSDCGFHARDRQEIALMLRGAQSFRAESLRVQMLDADAPYLDPVRPALWA